MTVDYLLVCEDCWMEDGRATLVGVIHDVVATGQPLLVGPLVLAIHARAVGVDGTRFHLGVVTEAGELRANLEAATPRASEVDRAFMRVALPAWSVDRPGTYRVELRVDALVLASTPLVVHVRPLRGSVH